MKHILPENPALILIDIQKGFDEIDYWGGQRNNPQAEDNARLLLQHWRKNKLPFFHVNHNSKSPASPLHQSNPGNQVKDALKPLPGEAIIKKNVHSAFIGTNLKELLDAQNITTVVVVGLTTDHCVSTTSRMASDYGYETFVVSDATATFRKKGINGTDDSFDAELVHQVTLASLQKDFATILSTGELLDSFNTN